MAVSVTAQVNWGGPKWQFVPLRIIEQWNKEQISQPIKAGSLFDFESSDCNRTRIQISNRKRRHLRGHLTSAVTLRISNRLLRSKSCGQWPYGRTNLLTHGTKYRYPPNFKNCISTLIYPPNPILSPDFIPTHNCKSLSIAVPFFDFTR